MHAAHGDCSLKNFGTEGKRKVRRLDQGRWRLERPLKAAGKGAEMTERWGRTVGRLWGHMGSEGRVRSRGEMQVSVASYNKWE